MKKLVFPFLISGLILNSVSAETLEERVERLEKRLDRLEQKINQLLEKGEKRGEEVKQYQSPTVVKTLPSENEKSVKPPNPVDFKVVSKKFVPAEFKSSVWRNEDKIVFKVDFKYKLNKPAEVVVGNFVIKDQQGNVLYEKQIKINKAFNFIKGTKIKPNEVVRMEVEVPYKIKDEKVVKIFKTPVDQLKYEFKPVQVVFADGTVLYYKKDW